MCKWTPTTAGLHSDLTFAGSALPSYPFPLLCLSLLFLACSSLGGCPPALGHDPLHALTQGTNCSWTLERHTRSYNHLEGDVRLRRLYSANKFFLCIDKTGKVDGTRRKNYPDSVFGPEKVKKKTETGTYLSCRAKMLQYSPSCKFKERIEENGYNTYASLHWKHRGRQMFVSLNGRGKPRRGHKARRRHPSTHFLPMLAT
uniref:Fibroblast growth factor 22 n=1 Tax=Sinocyclocheilus grahami TaxID=75366 RepID=A0A672LCZ7_SINGR